MPKIWVNLEEIKKITNLDWPQLCRLQVTFRIDQGQLLSNGDADNIRTTWNASIYIGLLYRDYTDAIQILMLLT